MIHTILYFLLAPVCPVPHDYLQIQPFLGTSLFLSQFVSSLRVGAVFHLTSQLPKQQAQRFAHIVDVAWEIPAFTAYAFPLQLPAPVGQNGISRCQEMSHFSCYSLLLGSFKSCKETSHCWPQQTPWNTSTMASNLRHRLPGGIFLLSNIAKGK